MLIFHPILDSSSESGGTDAQVSSMKKRLNGFKLCGINFILQKFLLRIVRDQDVTMQEFKFEQL